MFVWYNRHPQRRSYTIRCAHSKIFHAIQATCCNVCVLYHASVLLPRVQTLYWKINHHRDISIHRPKSRERGGDSKKRWEREKDPTVPREQRNKERPDWQDDEPATGTDWQWRTVTNMSTMPTSRVVTVSAESTEQRAARLQAITNEYHPAWRTGSDEHRRHWDRWIEARGMSVQWKQLSE